jgi:hypothetical protein
MKWLSERISSHRHEDYTTVIVSSKIEKWKESLIFGWLMLWTLMGAGIIYYLVTDSFSESMLQNTTKKDLQLYLGVFLVLWAYFEYRVGRVYWWRKKGMEYFKFEENRLIMKRAFGKYGKAFEYLYGNITDLKIIERKQKSFSKVMGSAFWDIGNEALSFEYQGRQIIFGIQLEPQEAKILKMFFRDELKKKLKAATIKA